MNKILIGFSLLFLGLTQSYATDTPTMCTMQYAPVCGSVQVQCIIAPCYPVRQTFGNSCMAAAANATNVTTGECDTMTPPVVGGDRDIYGCIASAGYTWSPSAQKCVRPWEQKMSPRAALRYGTWAIESLNGKTITTSGTLTFAVNIFTAKLCNNIRGKYRTVRDLLLVREASSTRMYCDSDIMKVEDVFSFSRSKFMVGSDTLTITTQSGDVMVWKRITL